MDDPFKTDILRAENCDLYTLIELLSRLDIGVLPLQPIILKTLPDDCLLDSEEDSVPLISAGVMESDKKNSSDDTAQKLHLLSQIVHPEAYEALQKIIVNDYANSTNLYRCTVENYKLHLEWKQESYLSYNFDKFSFEELASFVHQPYILKLEFRFSSKTKIGERVVEYFILYRSNVPNPIALFSLVLKAIQAPHLQEHITDFLNGLPQNYKEDLRDFIQVKNAHIPVELQNSINNFIRQLELPES